MKKMVTIILTIVLVMVNLPAMAEVKDGIFYGIDDYRDAKALVEEYAELKGYYDHCYGNAINNALYGLGGICLEDFINDFDKEWSIENFNKWSKTRFEISEIDTYEIGEADGIKFYRSRAKSETNRIAWDGDVDYYEADVIFFVFSLRNYAE